MMIRPHVSVLIITILALIAGGILWYLSTLNTPLEVLNVLNPRNAGEATLNEELPATLVDAPLLVPESMQSGVFATPRTLELPEGFAISVVASGFTKPRLLAFDPKGVLHVTDSGAGKVYALPDPENDGIFDEPVLVADGLDYPHGIVFAEDDLLIAEKGRVVRLERANDGLAREQQTTIIDGIPPGGGHISRTLALSPDGEHLYVSVGSSCNVCEGDHDRAAVFQYTLDGGNKTLFADGSRNAVGLAFRPGTTELWATENSRDLLGDDIPPDEVNILTKGSHYGWPYCYGEKIVDARYNKTEFCQTTVAPAIALQAHSAPLGLNFYTGDVFPQAFHGALFVGYHGSWNRREPTGYKVVVADPEAKTVIDFARGWLVNGRAWGRPVDVIAGPDGSLFITDDEAGAIYKVTYEASQ